MLVKKYQIPYQNTITFYYAERNTKQNSILAIWKCDDSISRWWVVTIDVV